MRDSDISDLRTFACDAIQNAGILLNLPQAAVTTAQMLLHQVYNSQDYTFDKCPVDITAMAALFLGAKIEEYPRKAREVIDVFTHVISLKFKRNIQLHFSDHDKIREELFTTEKKILKNLGFNLLSNYPHKILVNYYHAIVRALDPEHNVWRKHENHRILQLAWNYCNDSLRTDVFIQLSKEAVVCACIEMACEDTAMSFPRSTKGQAWYSLFVKNESEVKSAIDIISNLYQRTKIDTRSISPHLYLTKF